jgi:NAD(P)-dependent dehydrogenase (short-subunit alcohol dehydrogenase family)
MDKRLHGKIAIVTGAGTGIGEAIAHKFAKEGAAVVVCGLPGDPIDDVVARIRSHGSRAVAYAGDVSEEVHARGCVQAAIDSFGRLDILINNAGTFPVTSELQDFPLDAFDMMTRANTRSAFLMTRFALPYLQKTHGCIVSAGSEAGLIGIAQNAPYGATKGWMHAFMRGVAVEQAKYGVRANCVCPGAVDTAWTHKETGPMDKKMEKMTVEATPMGRRGTVEEIANVYAFLASDEASFVTGALWVVDGGITIGKGPVGKETPRDLREEPEGELHDLAHTHEGLEVMPAGETRR